jgi:hypothetical protein
MRKKTMKTMLLACLFSSIPMTVLSDQQVFMGGSVYKLTSKTATAKISCEGNACSQATMTWNGHGYTMHNGGSRRARISVRWYCSSSANTDLNPGQTMQYGNVFFCGAYSSNWI